MPDSVITVVGLQEIQRMLQDAPKTIVASCYLKALSAAANVIADEVEARTPVKSADTGGLLDRGELRESVMIAVELDSQYRGGVASIGFGKNGFVAAWVEYGHRAIGKRTDELIQNARSKATAAGRFLGNVPAHPFMGGALSAAADRAIDAAAKAMQESLDQNFPGGKL